MHIRFNRSLRGDYGRAQVGDVKMVTPEVGKSLVRRGLAAEVQAPTEEDADEKAAKLEAQLVDLLGKTVDEVKAAHSGPDLHALLKHMSVEVAPNLSKALLATALVEALTKRAEAS